MYYEVHGAGESLVLLHGAMSTIETSFGAAVALLAESRRVIAVEQQGHGRTLDVDRPLTYRQMAADRLGPACPTGIVPPGPELLSAVTSEWVGQFERNQLMLRLSKRLREKHGD